MICPNLVLAQTGRLFPTVDAIVAGSEAVYSGSIQSLTYEPSKTVSYRFSCTLNIKVDETLKGVTKKSLEVQFVTHFPRSLFEDVRDAGQKFLWVPNNEPSDSGLTRDLLGKMGVTGSDPEPDHVWFRLWERDIDRSADFDHNVFTADLRVISTWDELLREARSASARYPKGAIPLTYFVPPNSVARMCGDPNAYAAVVIPVSKETEQLGRTLVERPEKVVENARKNSKRVETQPNLSAPDVLTLRLAGLRLLRDHPSEDNRRLLTKWNSNPELQKDIEYTFESWKTEEIGSVSMAPSISLRFLSSSSPHH